MASGRNASCATYLLALVTDDDMTSIVRYEGDYGVIRQRLLWHCMYHLINHGTQHRSEAAAILYGFRVPRREKWILRCF